MPKCYGRNPKKATLKPMLQKYLLASVAAISIPAQILWYQAVAANGWPMYFNDRAGCCTYAAVGHMVQCWSANCGNLITPDANQILQGYIAATGYNPQTGANGARMRRN